MSVHLTGGARAPVPGSRDNESLVKSAGLVHPVAAACIRDLPLTQVRAVGAVAGCCARHTSPFFKSQRAECPPNPPTLALQDRPWPVLSYRPLCNGCADRTANLADSLRKLRNSQSFIALLRSPQFLTGSYRRSMMRARVEHAARCATSNG